MRASIYGRKSSDDSDRNTEARSTTRQVERATEYARAHGWTVDPAHVFVDDNVSGAEWQRRPGLNRLLAALEVSPPPFEVLVVSELSRIGRDTVRVPYTVQRIEEAGVEIHGYLSGQRISVDDELGEMTTMLHALAASYERRRAKQRTHDALRRRAEVGAVTGGRVFGYVNHRNGDGYVHRAIEPAEASVVRRIFQLASQGYGIKRIAAALNDEAAPAPMPRRAGPRGWAPSSVREVLRRELYAGTVVWNRTQKVVRRGAKRQRDRAAGEVLRVDAPGLRIVDKTLWETAHARLEAGRALYFARNGGRGFGRPPSGTVSPYLMTGLGTCALCGGSMFVHTRSHGGQRVPFWGCMTRHLRGRSVCPNLLEVPLADTDRAVMGAVRHDLLRVEVLETSLWKALSVLQAPATDDAEGDALRAELAQLEGEVGRLADAIARGGSLESLVGMLQQREQRRAHVRAALAERQHRAHRASDRRSDALDVMREALTDWQGMLRQETGQARTALTALLKGRLAFTPDPRRGLYTFEGPGTVAPIIAGVVRALAKGVVAPTGFEPVFQP